MRASARSTNQYEVITKFKVISKNKVNGDTLFLLELDYGGIFQVEGVPEEQLHPFLLIECPRMLFPFVRRIISDVTRDGGFPPLNVDRWISWRSTARNWPAAPQRRPQTPVRKGQLRPVTPASSRSPHRPASPTKACVGRVSSAVDPRRQAGPGAGGPPGGFRADRSAAGRVRRRQARDRAAGRRSAPDRLRPEFRCPAARRAFRASELSTPKRRQSASSEAGEPGNFCRAISSVSIARAMGSVGRPARPSSAFRNFMSKAALWITSCASPMKSRKARPMPEHGLVAQEVIAQAVHLERLFRHRAFGVDVLVIGPAGRQVVQQLDRADFDDAVALGRFEAGGFGVKHDLTHLWQPVWKCRPAHP